MNVYKITYAVWESDFSKAEYWESHIGAESFALVADYALEAFDGNENVEITEIVLVAPLLAVLTEETEVAFE